MFDLLPDELIIRIIQHLNLRDFLSFSSVSRRYNDLSHDHQYIRDQSKKLNTYGYVSETKDEFFRYYKTRAQRFSQEVAFFENNKEDVLNILNNIPNERRCLVGILKKIQKCSDHLQNQIDEKYILEADRMLNALNRRLIFRQLMNFEGTYLKLSCITRLPDNVIVLNLNKFKLLTKLDLRANCLERVPSMLSLCERLASLNLYENPIMYLPINIGDCHSLEYLYLCDGDIFSLPPSFFLLSNLKWLSLCHMNIGYLSPDIQKLQQLTWLNLADNQLTALPNELTQLKQLREIYLNNNLLKITQSEQMIQYFKQINVKLSYLLKTQKSSVSSVEGEGHSKEEPFDTTVCDRPLFYYKKCFEKKPHLQKLEGLDLDNDTLMRSVYKKS